MIGEQLRITDRTVSLRKNRALKNGLWMYALQAFNTIMPLLTLPYITRILGASKYGHFSVVLNIVTYLQVIVEYGFAFSATREVALQDENNNLSQMFSAIVSSRLLLYIVSIFIVIMYCFLFGKSTENIICLIVMTFNLIGYCFQSNWLFQGKQDMKYITIANIVARLSTMVGIFALVHSSKNILEYCILYSLSPIVANAVGVIIIHKKYKIRWVWTPIKTIIWTLKSGIYVFFTQFSAKVFGAIGVTFLGIFEGDYITGIYSAIYKVPYLLLLAWNPVSQVLYPISSKQMMKNMTNGRKFIKRIHFFCMLIWSIMALIISLGAKTIVNILFGKEYTSYYYIIFPLLIWVLLGINNNFNGIQTLLGGGYDKEYNKAFQIGTFITILLNYLLITNYGIIGASFAPMISEFFFGLLLEVKVHNLTKINKRENDHKEE